MKGRQLVVLVVAAVGLVAYAVMSSKETKMQEAPPDGMGAKLLGELPVNAVEQIAIRSSAGTVTVARVNEAWVLPCRYGYPANFEKVKSAIMKLADLKVGQIARVDEAQKLRLRLVAPGAAAAGTNATGTLVLLLGKGDRKLAEVLAGDVRRKKESEPNPYGGGMGGYPDGQFVSVDGGKTVCVIKESLDDLSVQPRDWLDAEIANIEPSDLDAVTIVSTNGETLKLAKGKDGGPMVPEGMTEKEEADAVRVSNAGNALSYLRIEDVADPAVKDADMGMDKPATFTAHTRQGAVYTVKVGAADAENRRYMRFDADFVAPVLVPLAPEAATNAAAKAEYDAKAADRTAQEKKVAEFKARVSKWTYLVNSYKAEGMTLQRKDVVKTKETPKPEEKEAELVGTPAPPAEARDVK